ncbi:MAG: hypothetical protein ACOX2O_00650 [Bdellovibrionota bacterium]
MTKVNEKERKIRSKKEAAYTLLEYCAGAAVIAGIVWVAVSALGSNLGDLLGAIGEWATTRATEIRG